MIWSELALRSAAASKPRSNRSLPESRKGYRIIEPSGAGEVPGGGAAGDLERRVDEAGGEAGEGELLHAGDELGGGGAGDDGAVEVNGGGGDFRIGRRGGEGGGGEHERAAGREDFHGSSLFSVGRSNVRYFHDPIF
jgi:hypothetical protein